MEIKLGMEAKDQLTGFEGIVTARIDYLTGCVQYKVTPKSLSKDGKPEDGEWLDESRLIASQWKAVCSGDAVTRAVAPGGPFGGEPPPRHP